MFLFIVTGVLAVGVVGFAIILAAAAVAAFVAVSVAVSVAGAVAGLLKLTLIVGLVYLP